MRRLGLALLAGFAASSGAWAEDGSQPAPVAYIGGMPPVMDNMVLAHVLLEQFEDRVNGTGNSFRYDGQGWIGTDDDKLWIKSEGRVLDTGRFTDGQHEALYDRAISTYFDVQTGVRVDLDDGKPSNWGAVGFQGLAPYFFDVEATAYVGAAGHLAARVKASYDLLITQRLILQPEIEANFYSKADSGQGIGSGLSDIDAGLRLRYEITRKFAPYIGIAYEGFYGQSAHFARQEGESTGDPRFVFGIRAWL